MPGSRESRLTAECQEAAADGVVRFLRRDWGRASPGGTLLLGNRTDGQEALLQGCYLVGSKGLTQAEETANVTTVKVNSFAVLKKRPSGCAWVAQSVECLTSAQVMISQFVSSSPASGSVLTVQSQIGRAHV